MNFVLMMVLGMAMVMNTVDLCRRQMSVSEAYCRGVFAAAIGYAFGGCVYVALAGLG